MRREDAFTTICSGRSVQPYVDRIDRAVVPDNAVQGAYDKAFEDVNYIVHIAGVWPLPTLHPDNDIYHPFMQSMKNVLTSAKASGTVKRIVFTQAGAGLVDSEVGDTYGRGMTQTLDEHVKVNSASLTYTPPLNSSHQAYCAAKAQCMDYLDQLRRSGAVPFDIVQVIPGTVIGPSEFVKTEDEAKKHMDRQSRALLFDDNTPRYAFGFVHVDDCAKVHIEALDEEKVPTGDIPPWFVAAATTEQGLDGDQVWSKAVRAFEITLDREIQDGLFKLGKERAPTNMPYRVDSSLTERMLCCGERMWGLEESVMQVAGWYSQFAAKESS